MAIKIKNELGNVEINENVIASIAGNAVQGCQGIADMSSGPQLWGKENISKGIKVASENDKLIIDISIVIEFGVKIATIAETIMNAVTKQVKELSGFDVEKVNVVVEGIKVDKQ